MGHISEQILNQIMTIRLVKKCK